MFDIYPVVNIDNVLSAPITSEGVSVDPTAVNAID